MAQIMGVSSSSSPFRPAAAADLTYPFPFALFFVLVFLWGRKRAQGRNPTHQGWQSRHLAQGGLQRGCQERQCPSFLNLTCTTHAIDLCSETLGFCPIMHVPLLFLGFPNLSESHERSIHTPFNCLTWWLCSCCCCCCSGLTFRISTLASCRITRGSGRPASYLRWLINQTSPTYILLLFGSVHLIGFCYFKSLK